MKSLDRIILIAIFFTISFFIGSIVVYGQDATRTIQVSGSSEYNLSPDEIIISLSFEEYFTNENENAESKVKIEDIEKRVLLALKSANINDKEITSGSVTLIRPRIHNTYKKRRLNKTISICIKNTDEYILLVREIENAGLFEKVISDFRIAEYRNTKKTEYLTQLRAKAYENAVSKADLILSQSGEKKGKVIKVNEKPQERVNGNGSFYEVSNNSNSSGFKPIVISYQLEVVFEIL